MWFVFVVVDICLISKKRYITRCYKHTTCKFRKKNPKNKSNIDMLVDARIGGEEEEEAVLEKKTMTKNESKEAE
jgi:hypothetical protein